MEEEAIELFDNMFYLKLFSSGRTMWVANTEVANKYPLSNFNCSYMTLNNFNAYKEMFYLLMLGSGVSFRTMPYDVEKMPSYRIDLSTSMKEYKPVPVEERLENTESIISGNEMEIIVGDSKQGWVEALDLYFRVRTEPEYSMIKKVMFNFDSVRPKGEILKRFGGKASGHESIKIMFSKIANVLENANGKLKPINAMDKGNIIAENVVSGGVRRYEDCVGSACPVR